MKHQTRGLAAICAAAFLLFGCNYSNPHGSQELPPTTRVITDPSGAKLLVVDQGLEFETPCELPETVDVDDVVEISKDGYLSYVGPLENLTQVASGTYKLKLAR